MKAEFIDIPLINNIAASRFELHVNGFVVFIEYTKEAEHLYALNHTEAAPELAGTGAAAALVEKTFSWMEEDQNEILPYCPYLFSFLKKHPESKRIVSERFPGYKQLYY